MFQGNWQCSSCGAAITELPFEPRSEKGLTCRTCYAKGKAEGEVPLASAAVSGVASEQTGAPPFDPTAAPELAASPVPPEFTEAAAVKERTVFAGEWSCSVCGGSITSLPFQPRSTKNLKCLTCYKESR